MIIEVINEYSHLVAYPDVDDLRLDEEGHVHDVIDGFGKVLGEYTVPVVEGRLVGGLPHFDDVLHEALLFLFIAVNDRILRVVAHHAPWA